jgi:hypothetical protein
LLEAACVCERRERRSLVEVLRVLQAADAVVEPPRLLAAEIGRRGSLLSAKSAA